MSSNSHGSNNLKIDWQNPQILTTSPISGEGYLVGDLIVTVSTKQLADPQPLRTAGGTSSQNEECHGSQMHRTDRAHGSFRYGLQILLSTDTHVREIAVN